jgi:hypothetical protein
MEQHKHSELRTTVGLMCDALGAIQVRPGGSLLQSHLRVAFEWARTQVKEALHLRMRHALAVFRSHYQKIDLEALSEGYVDIPKEELDAIDEEVLEPVKTLAAKFEDEIVPPSLEL